MSLGELLSVESFAPEGEFEVLQYPFRRPEGGFLTDGERVYSMPDSYEKFVAAADKHLAEAELPGIAERIPVVAYGANSNPYRLDQKMSAYEAATDEVALELRTVPHLRATIPHAVVAWHGKPGQGGSTFAELYRDETTVDQAAASHVSFLTTRQLALMHATEGVTYHLAEVETRVGIDEAPLKAYAYVAGHSVALLKDQKPVLVKRTDETTDEQAMTAEEAVNYMLTNAESVTESTTARELVLEMKGLRLIEKKARQVAVQKVLGAAGLSRSFCFPTEDGFIGRADFSSFSPEFVETANEDGTVKKLPLIQLMEQVVADLRPADPALHGQQKTDIAEKLRRRAHDELADLLANS